MGVRECLRLEIADGNRGGSWEEEFDEGFGGEGGDFAEVDDGDEGFVRGEDEKAGELVTWVLVEDVVLFCFGGGVGLVILFGLNSIF